ncbi:PREDICTED: secreted protein C10orf99 homolog isoform X2 [Myotis davidii]|uniref:secreted protein C10orf99 homolog isoform X2 n=1 Tax=Myotis davidii TaxID=225400 RepID=UPI000767634F|nr:PREDICTED: secreted protein C10orf99 homolog isoform X2 [Myotis davidii]
MRALVLCSLLCTLLLCFSVFSVFSVEGKRHPRPPAKPWKGKPCCSQVPDPALRTQKGDGGLTFSVSHLLHLLATSLLAGVSVTVEATSLARPRWSQWGGPECPPRACCILRGSVSGPWMAGTPCEDLQTMQVQASVPLLGGARGAPTGLVSPSKAQFLRRPWVPPGAGTEAQALGASAPRHWSP